MKTYRLNKIAGTVMAIGFTLTNGAAFALSAPPAGFYWQKAGGLVKDSTTKTGKVANSNRFYTGTVLPCGANTAGCSQAYTVAANLCVSYGTITGTTKGTTTQIAYGVKLFDFIDLSGTNNTIKTTFNQNTASTQVCTTTQTRVTCNANPGTKINTIGYIHKTEYRVKTHQPYRLINSRTGVVAKYENENYDATIWSAGAPYIGCVGVS